MMRSIVLGLCLAAGCAAPATELKACPSGDCEAEARTADDKAAAERATKRLRTAGLLKQASFDLNCPGNELVIVELAGWSRGVSGCGKRASYARRADRWDEWILNSTETATPTR